jgi:hypothetical protein
MDELQDAIVVMGVAHTRLFNGTEGVELILLDLASGQDFTLPVTEDQLATIFQYKSMGVRDGEAEELRPSPPSPGKDADAVRNLDEVDQF